MTDQPRTKVVILGGGIAALTTAYYLTRTEELRAKYEVSLYQLGWRLGGKLASGREGPHARNVEHGLHVWFGCYENAFRMTRELYAAWRKDPDNPFQTVEDAFRKRSYTPIGLEYEGGTGYYPLLWPEDEEMPGDGTLWPSVSGVITKFLDFALNAILHKETHTERASDTALGELREDAAEEAVARILGGRRLSGQNKGELAKTLRDLLQEVGEALVADSLTGRAARKVVSGVLQVLRDLARADKQLTPDGRWPMPAQAIELALSVVIGLLDPRWNILVEDDLNAINQFEFRRFLLEVGADPWVVKRGAFVTVLYNTMFAYDEGSLEKPNMEAGTAARILLRIVATYKGAVFWFVEAGMGELVIAPLYEVLRERGVQFHFFHRVKKLELAASGESVARVVFDVQAETLDGSPYDPLIQIDHIPCWLTTPKWEHLKNGEELKARGVNFESHWCPEPPAGSKTLHMGADFDEVVLGISLGAFKKLNHEPTMCDELAARNVPFRNMVDNLGLVPSVSVQAWLTKDISELQFNYRRENMEGTLPALVSGDMPLDIWADMTQVLKYESWPSAPQSARSVHYFCSTLDTQLFKAPSTETTVPQVILDQVTRSALGYFERAGPKLWPGATKDQELDWNVFVDDSGATGRARFKAQYVRANIDPTECCVTSLRDTTRFRLKPGESGFKNLTLTGAWTRTGLNATCVEGAVMSGMAAAKALTEALPYSIVGQDFLQKGIGS